MGIKEKIINGSWGKFLILLLILVIVGILSWHFKINLEDVKVFLQRFPSWSAVVAFILLYVIGTIVMPLPPTKDIFKIAGAFCLGALLSSVGVYIAEILNAIIVFYMARYFGQDFVQAKLKGRARRIDEKIASSGFLGLLLLRLVPIVPWRVMNPLVGLSSFSFSRYMVIVIVGSPLRIFWLQYILAGVGMAFTDPKKLQSFLLAHPVLFIGGLSYFVLAVILGLTLKRKKVI